MALKMAAGSRSSEHPVLDQALHIARRHAPPGIGSRPPLLDEVVADIVAVSGALLVGMGRRHPLAGIVEEQPGKQARLGGIAPVLRSTRFSARRSCTFCHSSSSTIASCSPG